MFLNFYGLQRQPFGVAPDRDCLYLSPQHKEALASLLYGTETDRGLLALIALPGMGKTALLYSYLAALGDTARTAFVFRTDCESREFVRHLISDIGVDCTGLDLPTACDAFQKIVAKEAEAGRRVVLVIDEAQNLDEKTLESIRLLANFEMASGKPMLIVLAGQPQLARRLAQNALLQLRQRISMTIKIASFDYLQTNAYIDHRLQMAGGRADIFSEDARGLISDHSGGIPRCINNLCFNAMSLGFVEGIRAIPKEILTQVIADLDMESPAERPRKSVVQVQPPRAETMNFSSVRSPASFVSRSMVCAKPERVESRPEIADGPKPITEFLNKAAADESTAGNKTLGERANSVPPASSRHARLGWISKLVAACAFSLAIGTSSGKVERQAPKTLPGEAYSGQTSLDPATITNISDSVLINGSEAIRVDRGQTVYGICIHTLGRYDQAVVNRLRKLNPWFKDPAQIHAGVVLRIPARASSSTLRSAPETVRPSHFNGAQSQ